MSKKHQKKKTISTETQDEALRIAKGSQKPGQTKEQTKLIAQGIQHGIDQYKKQQKSKSRELDKKLKKVSGQLKEYESMAESSVSEADLLTATSSLVTLLPWILLAATWLGIGVVTIMSI